MGSCARATLAYGYVWADECCKSIHSEMDENSEELTADHLWEKWEDEAEKAGLVLGTHCCNAAPMLYLATGKITTTQGNVQRQVLFEMAGIVKIVKNDVHGTTKLNNFLGRMELQRPHRNPMWFLVSWKDD
ncbi:hypothetical protein LCGC14_2050810 [marine sediment metagenome]|uniref:Uncharacterized protein n=1 Tax=marine sediment metagenome TaxID=412755 RepID=A0A0F9EP93_9ZZZZ